MGVLLLPASPAAVGTAAESWTRPWGPRARRQALVLGGSSSAVGAG